MTTTSEAFAAVRARIDGGAYPYPIYYNGDNTPILPDTPSPFAFVVFNNEGSSLVAYGGGRGKSIYRNRARVEAFVFSPFAIGMEAVMDAAEIIAVRLRSFRDDFISCFESDVIPVGQGSSLSVPGLTSEVSNYQCAIVEALVMFDQSGGGIVDVAPPEGGVEEWPPANAKIAIDLVGNRAWTEIDGDVAVNTLLGSDPNTEAGWAVTNYDPANLTANGYASGDTGGFVALINDALSMVLGSCTYVIRIRISVADGAGNTALALLSADGNDAIEFDLQQAITQARVVSWNNALGLHSPNGYSVDGEGAINVFALTTTPTRAEFAVNGFAALAGVVDATVRPPDNPLVAATFGSLQNDAIQSITIYDPLPDTTGLSELSQIS